MNSRKSAEFFETKLVRLSAETQDIKIKTLQAFNKCALIGQGSVFILVASALFILPVITPDDLSKIPAIIAVILFIFGPISEIVSSIPYISRAAVSIQVVDNLESQLDGFLIAKPIEGSALPELGEAFESIVCNQVLFSYSTEAGEAPFSIGPLDFTLRAGEVVFIIGGNGSGKSTFLKVLTGLYPHKSGEFTVNGHLLGPLQITAYRNLFSPIFSDYHLFDKLYGVDSVDDAEAEELIIQMGLSEKTQIIRREISNRKLSTGQRKRLALAVAILEDKPIFLFDEWAADQDPEFRRYFYEKILPELVADGKTVIAATHDDRYFHVANRVLKLEYGKFVPWASPPAGG
jgi:putative ATP-binding cassette transporter